MKRSTPILVFLLVLVTSLTVTWERALWARSESSNVTGSYLADANEPNDPNGSSPQPEIVLGGTWIVCLDEDPNDPNQPQPECI